MFGLVLWTVLAQAPPDPAATGGTPPEQGLASLDSSGKLRITRIGCACVQDQTVTVQEEKEGRKVPVQLKIKVSTLTTTTAEVPVKYVEAFTADGKPITAQRLTTLLAKERPVLVAADGRKVDPFLLQLYKEDTLVLVPAAGLL